MKLEIKSPEGTWSLPIPMRMLENRLIVGKLTGALNRRWGLSVDAGQLETLLQAARSFRRTHPEWILLEIESADAEGIRITV